MRGLSRIGIVLLTILKWMLKLCLGVSRLTLELIKIFFILLHLVLGLFFAFVGAGMP